MRRRVEAGLLIVLLGGSVAAAAVIRSSAAQGLSARFWANPDWQGAPRLERLHSMPDAAHASRGMPSGGSAEWTGAILVDDPGEYEFEVSSNGRVWLSVGGRSVVDSGEGHTRSTSRGKAILEPGAHAFRIRYVAGPAAPALDIFWSGPRAERHLLRDHEVAPTGNGAGSRGRRSWVRTAAVAVPTVWALLLIYVPARLAGFWLWREVRRMSPRWEDRRSLLTALCVGFGLSAWGLTWGLDSIWAPDELLPGQVRDLIARRFADGWYDKYPPLHYQLIGIPVWAFELASQAGLLSAESVSSQMAQLAAMRAVSVVMGLGVLTTAFLCAAELYGSRRAVLASWSLLLTPMFVYYSKIANVDVPALFWLSLAILGFIRIWTRYRVADFVLFGAGAAAAMATKDQVYASVLMMPVGVVAAGMRAEDGASVWRGFARAIGNRRVALGAAASVGTFAVCHNALFNFDGVVSHFRLLSTLNDLAIFPRSARGYADMTALTFRLYAFSLGWPLFLAAVAGIAAAVSTREKRWWLWLLVVPASFHVAFTFATQYTTDRFLFGGVFVLALFAGAFLAFLLDMVPRRGGGRVAVAGALGYSLLSAVSIDVMMQVDVRKSTAAWLESHAAEGDRIGMLGWYLPSPGPSLRPVNLEFSPDAVRATMPEWLMFNGRHAARYEHARSPQGRELLSGLANGSLGYVEAYRRRNPVPGWAILQFREQFKAPRESSWTNLDKINPEMVIYRRRR